MRYRDQPPTPCRSRAKKSHEHPRLVLSRESPKAQVRTNRDICGQSELEVESPTAPWNISYIIGILWNPIPSSKPWPA